MFWEGQTDIISTAFLPVAAAVNESALNLVTLENWK